jgi:hypothetical protein
MPEDLKKQVEEISRKLKEQDEAAIKEGEKEFRAEMTKDTAGTVIRLFSRVQAQLAVLDAQLVATNPLVSVLRGMDTLGMRLAEIEERLAAVEKKLKEA